MACNYLNVVHSVSYLISGHERRFSHIRHKKKSSSTPNKIKIRFSFSLMVPLVVVKRHHLASSASWSELRLSSHVIHSWPSQVVFPILEWERTTFEKPILALLLFASIATFPIFLLPTSPCMWVAGMTFGYGYGFLLIMGAASLGMSLPFFIGSLCRHRIHVCPMKLGALSLSFPIFNSKFLC